MEKQIVLPGQGKSYDWAKDHVVVNAAVELSDGRLTLVGTTLNVPPGVWHEVKSPQGARLLTIFSPGGFDSYLEELVALTEGQYADKAFMTELSEKYDIFER